MEICGQEKGFTAPIKYGGFTPRETHYNAVDLDTGYLHRYDENEAVEILEDAFLTC